MRVGGVIALLTLVALAGCLGDEANETDSDCPEPAMDSHESMETMESGMESESEEDAPAGNETEESEEVPEGTLRLRQPEGGEAGNETMEESGNETMAESGNETMEDADDAMEHEEHDHGADCPAEEGHEDHAMSTMAGAYLEADAIAGEAPMDVVFEFGVVGINEDEFLEWTLDADADGIPESEGNGINLQGGANFTFTFTQAGDYNATFEATDGIDAWNATILISITAAEVEEEAPEEGEAAPEADPGVEFPEDPGCKTDTAALLVPGANIYVTDYPGIVYIYEESNGIEGLQRDDSAWSDNCANPDTLIF